MKLLSYLSILIVGIPPLFASIPSGLSGMEQRASSSLEFRFRTLSPDTMNFARTLGENSPDRFGLARFGLAHFGQGSEAGRSSENLFTFVQEQQRRSLGAKPGRRGGPLPLSPGAVAGSRGGPMPPPLFKKLRDLPPEEQEKVLRNNQRFQELPKERQDELLNRLHRFQALSPEQKEMIEQRFAAFSKLTPEQREKVREIYQQHWRNLPPARRKALTEEFRKLREMPPGDREKYLSSNELEGRFNPDERDILRQLNSLPGAP